MNELRAMDHTKGERKLRIRYEGPPKGGSVTREIQDWSGGHPGVLILRVSFGNR